MLNFRDVGFKIINGSNMRDVSRRLVPAMHFVSEKSSLGAFVYSPFTNHNRSKKLLEKYSKKDSHLAMYCAYMPKSYRKN